MKHNYPKYIQALALILLISITGCTSDATQTTPEPTDPAKVTQQKAPIHYSITEEDGSYYLNFSDGNEPPKEYSSQLATMMFDSLAEMQDTFLNNKLTEGQINQIKDVFPKDLQGRIQICDMNRLQQPVLPSNLTLGTLGLAGDRYSFFVNSVISSSSIHGSFHCLTKEDYDDMFERDYENYFEKNTIHLTSTTEEPDRNSTVYDYTTSAGTLRRIRYAITQGSKTLYIDESYRLSMKDDSLPVSDTVPKSISIYGCDNGEYFNVYLSGFSERPSVEWLSSFGLTDFVKSNDTATK